MLLGAAGAAAADKIVATGGTVYTDGDYKIHLFTASGTFSVTTIADGTTDTAIALANGGDWGIGGDNVDASCDGGNGGSGGMGGNYRITTGQNFTTLFASTGNYSVTVGAAGGGATTIGSWGSVTIGGSGGAGGSGGSSGNGSGGFSSPNAGLIQWIPNGGSYLATAIGKGGGGGGGGGGASPFSYGGGPGGNGGGAGGNGGNAGQNGSNGNNGSNPATAYGGGDGGGGGGGGGGECDFSTAGGNGGQPGSGIALIRYKYR